MGRGTEMAGPPLFPNVGVISLVPETWGGMWLSRQQILTRLCRYFHVLWFNPPQNWRRLWSGKENALNHEDTTPPPSAGFTIYTQSRWLPKFYRPAFLASYTERTRLRQAARILRGVGCEKTILYVWIPDFADALDLLDYDVSCYHIADEYSFSSVETPVSEREAGLLSRVDQVYIHSPALLEKKGSFNPNTRYVTNGVDYHAFAAERPEPEDLADVPHPRVGYIGRLKVQLDWDVLTYLANRHRDYSFVFVGPIGYMGAQAEKMGSLFRMPNVYYMGNKSVKDIAAYTRHLDVCLLCYALNDYTKYIFPLKLHEYLAAGRPVVGSRIRSLEEFSSVVRIAQTPAEWSAGVAESITPEAVSPAKVAERQRVAREFDWNRLVRMIAESLCEHLGKEYSDRLNDVSQVGLGQ